VLKQEHFVIIGAGIAGLNAALALNTEGRTLTLVEKDGPPPESSADEAFEQWQRKGVGHLRHSHAFLARLYLLLREKYPDLLRQLVEAGCRELQFADGIPETLRDSYEAIPEDEDLTILTSRRTTLEFVMRNYVSNLPGVRFASNRRVTDLLHTQKPDGTLFVQGVKTEQDGQPEEITADIVIDAAGKNALGMDWLRKAGLNIRAEVEGAGILYFTRHYRLRPGRDEPQRTKFPGAADLGYVKYGLFPADNGCFSITLAVPEIEMELRRTIIRPENFDKICRSIPGIADWVDPDRSDPKSRVFGMGELVSQWRHMVENGKPVTENYFPMGDNLIRSNPLYGRGCSFAAIQAQGLAEALALHDDPTQQALHYYEVATREIRPFYDAMRKQDQAAIRRAAHELNPEYKPGLKARIMKSFVTDAVEIAIRSDLSVFRQVMHGFHMLDHPTAWLKKPGNMFKLLRTWARGKKRNKKYYLPKIGPNRDEMFVILELSPHADWKHYNRAA
jgi:2-polyprenyl-6-methoxyphenol hydroxylase-like FAD-dependent oxidoreductase